MSISKDKGVISERLEELVDSSTSSKSLLGNDDPGKAIGQGTVVDINDQRKKFSISLSRKEIEEDFYKITGTGLNPKPKKRPKVVQKQLDVLFPGSRLSEITKDMYKMPISKDREVTSERLEELVNSSTSFKPLLGKDDPDKAVMQETLVDKNNRRKEFSISLSRKEIEEDFLKIMGTKPNLKPKTRPKVMQKHLDMPISKDSEVTSDRLEELVNSSTSFKPLLGKDDPGKVVMQETLVDKNDRRKEFSISLSRKEIEEDFQKITGTKLNLKPKTRPKVVQKQLDALFPGSGLSEITKDMYKIAE